MKHYYGFSKDEEKLQKEADVFWKRFFALEIFLGVLSGIFFYLDWGMLGLICDGLAILLVSAVIIIAFVRAISEY